MRRTSQNSALVLASIAAGFLILETLARLLIDLPSPYPVPSSPLVWDQRGYWINQPGFVDVFDNHVDFRARTVTVDGNGARATPCRTEAPKAKRKLILVGDSETFGWGLDDEETWPNRLQCLANAATLDVGVYNFGVPGTNLDQYYFRIRHFLGGLGAEDIVLFIVTWNDFRALQDPRLPSLEPFACDDPNASRAAAGIDFPVCLTQPVKRYDDSTTWRKTLYARSGIFIPVFADAKLFTDTAPFASALAHVLIPRARHLYYRLRGETVLDKLPRGTFESNGAIMGAIGDALAAKKIVHHFLFLPSRVSFDDALYASYSQGGRAFPDQDFFAHYGRAECGSRRLSCRSLFPALRGPGPNPNAFAFDGHLSPRGAAAVAERIFDWLASGQLARPFPPM